MGKIVSASHLRRRLLLFYDHFFLRRMAGIYSVVGQRGFLLIWAVATGFVTGCAVVLIRVIASSLESLSEPGRTELVGAILIFLLPILGIFLSWGIKKLLSKSNSNADMTMLIKAIRERKPELIKLETFSHIIASPLTAGLRASAGLTTPSVLAGASIGANIGRMLHIAPDKTVQLMTCGTAAGIAAIFGSPISGVLFAVEVLLPKMSVNALIPVLLAAAGATVTVQIFLENSPFFAFLCRDWDFRALPYYIVLGILSSLIGIAMIRGNRKIGTLMTDKIPSDFIRMLLGASLVAILVFLLPEVAGEGISSIQKLTQDHTLSSAVPEWMKETFRNPFWLFFFGGCALLAGKIVATSITLNCGGSGGFFAPTLFAGAFFGFTVKQLFDRLHWGNISDTNFIALGMCGVFASAFRAPLTGIFLVVEMSGSYVLMIPLILVAALSFFITGFLEDSSIYTNAEKKDQNASETEASHWKRKMIHDYTAFRPDTSVNWKNLLKTTEESCFPVVDGDGYLHGIIFRKSVEEAVSRGDENALPKKLMHFPKVTLQGNESVSVILASMKIFGETKLPALNAKSRFAGFITLVPRKGTVRTLPAPESPDNFAVPEKPEKPL